jgi:hypothetical protein
MRTLVAAALLALAAAALLAGSGAGQAADSACLADAERYCKGIPYGQGRVLTCLQSRWKDLSSACQQDIQQVQNRANEVASACAGDVWQYCNGVLPGGDRVRVCLWSRWDQLSSTCRDAWARIGEKAQALVDSCSADAEQVCPGVQPGGGRLFLCLKLNEGKVSTRCRSALR